MNPGCLPHLPITADGKVVVSLRCDPSKLAFYPIGPVYLQLFSLLRLVALGISCANPIIVILSRAGRSVF